MAKQRQNLSGKVVAITGGARGIGKATATALVRKGCRVAIGDLDLSLAEETAAGLGGNSIALPLDVTDRGSFTTFLDAAALELGPIDVLINNAGIMPVTPFAKESDESLKRQLDINVYGVIVGMQLAIERFQPRGSGHIVNLASQAGKGGFPGSGIEIACVMPTVVNTELTAGVGQRLIRPVEAEDVANEIFDALEVPRFDVWVPRINGAFFKLVSNLPRGMREGLGRLMKVDKLMTEVDHGARRRYEERAAHSRAEGDASAAEPSPEREAA